RDPRRGGRARHEARGRLVTEAVVLAEAGVERTRRGLADGPTARRRGLRHLRAGPVERAAGHAFGRSEREAHRTPQGEDVAAPHESAHRRFAAEVAETDRGEARGDRPRIRAAQSRANTERI